jgi:hypothetical protein
MNVNIGNPRVDADSFKFEVQITRINAWGAGFPGIGNSDFYFNYNDLAFTGNPFLADTNVNITSRPNNYSIQVGIIGNQFRVRLDWTLAPPFSAWTPGEDVTEDLCTVAWEIANPAENSGVTWDEINSGFNNVEGAVIEPVYMGNGDISLPVELALFTANIMKEGVGLKWVTESEIENVGFEVWRSQEEKGDYILLSSYQHNAALRGQGNSNTRHEYIFLDNLVVMGQHYWYKLVDVALNGERGVHGPISVAVLMSDDRLTSVSSDIPTDFKLHHNYPNPFNPSTRIRFDIPRIKGGQLEVSLVIYNALGQMVRRLYSGEIGAGSFEVEWDGRSDAGNPIPSGMYFAVFAAKDYYQTIRLVLLK